MRRLEAGVLVCVVVWIGNEGFLCTGEYLSSLLGRTMAVAGFHCSLFLFTIHIHYLAIAPPTQDSTFLWLKHTIHCTEHTKLLKLTSVSESSLYVFTQPYHNVTLARCEVDSSLAREYGTMVLGTGHRPSTVEFKILHWCVSLKPSHCVDFPHSFPSCASLLPFPNHHFNSTPSNYSRYNQLGWIFLTYYRPHWLQCRSKSLIT
jgi:hypothetical protein